MNVKSGSGQVCDSACELNILKYCEDLITIDVVVVFHSIVHVALFTFLVVVMEELQCQHHSSGAET